MAVDDPRPQQQGGLLEGLPRWTGRDAAPSLPGWVLRGAEVLAVLALALLAVRVRHPARLFTHQFWLDESWVADSTRASWGQLRLLTSSTPIGWTVLLRAVPRWGDAERYRLLPLAFAVAGAGPAWFLGRQLAVTRRGTPTADGLVVAWRASRHRPSWARWLGPSVAGLAAVLAPTALGYPYLKQYTAEAFTSLLLVALVAWVERRWSPVRLSVLAATAVLSFLVANTALFVTVAVFGGLALTSLARRSQWRRLAWLAGTAAVVAVADLWVYRTFLAASNGAAMQRYWRGRYIPATEGWGEGWRFVAPRALAAIESIGFGPWPLALALLVAGVAALWRAGVPAAALALPIMVVEVVVAGLQRRYPFLELRTSMFLIVLATVVAALGVVALASLALRWRGTALLGLAVLVGAGALFLPEARQAARIPLFEENAKGQVRLIEELRRPGDVVVLGSLAAYHWAYYGSERPTFVPAAEGRTIRFEVIYPHDRGLLVAKGRTPALIKEAMDQVPPGTRRVWVLVNHEEHLIPIWVRNAARHGWRLAAPMAHLCAAFTEAERARAGVSSGQCPLLFSFG